jgi:hypothetical protein
VLRKLLADVQAENAKLKASAVANAGIGIGLPSVSETVRILELTTERDEAIQQAHEAAIERDRRPLPQLHHLPDPLCSPPTAHGRARLLLRTSCTAAVRAVRRAMPSECCRCTAPIGRVPMDALLRFAPLLIVRAVQRHSGASAHERLKGTTVRVRSGLRLSKRCGSAVQV